MTNKQSNLAVICQEGRGQVMSNYQRDDKIITVDLCDIAYYRLTQNVRWIKSKEISGKDLDVKSY